MCTCNSLCLTFFVLVCNVYQTQLCLFLKMSVFTVSVVCLQECNVDLCLEMCSDCCLWLEVSIYLY